MAIERDKVPTVTDPLNTFCAEGLLKLKYGVAGLIHSFRDMRSSEQTVRARFN